MSFSLHSRIRLSAKKFSVSVFVVLSFVFLSSIAAKAQVSSGGRPQSWRHELRNIERVDTLMEINVDSVLAEDAKDTREHQLYRIGAAIPFSVDMMLEGQWDTIPEVGRVCRMAIHVPVAYSICVNYSDFYLPEGATFFVYHPTDTNRIRGAFTSANNKESGKFGTGFVRGEEIELEYFEPVGTMNGRISIGTVVHVFRGGQRKAAAVERDSPSKLLNYGDALPCHINVKCPEGLPFEAQSRSVVMIAVGGSTRVASGALVNNVRGDKKPYILTAGHVYDANDSVDTWLMYFNYFQPLCDSAFDGNLEQVVEGKDLKAYGEIIDGDFALIEAASLPTSYDVYFAGWNKANSAFDSAYTIHHPAGDVQKISFAEYNGDGGYSWGARFHPNAGTGVIEGNSSGGCLFDYNGRIVGQHTGGANDTTTCSWNDQNATYGKLARAWSTLSSPSEQLKYWLDPDTTNATVLNGLDTRTACCVGMRGNFDNDPFDSVDLIDVSYMIAYLFYSGSQPVCWEEGNCDGDSAGSIDMVDLTLLVDHLFISFTPLPNCP